MGVRLPLAVGLMVMAVVALSTTVGVAGDDGGKAAVAAVKDGGIAPLSYGGFCQRPASAKLASSASLTAGSDTETATATTPAGTGVLQLAAGEELHGRM